MNEQLIQRITAVVKTLSAATIRADQVDVCMRIEASTRALRRIIEDLQKHENPTTQEVNECTTT